MRGFSAPLQGSKRIFNFHASNTVSAVKPARFAFGTRRSTAAAAITLTALVAIAIAALPGPPALAWNIYCDPLDSGVTDPHNSMGVAEDTIITLWTDWPEFATSSEAFDKIITRHPNIFCLIETKWICTYRWRVEEPVTGASAGDTNPTETSAGTPSTKFTFETPSNPLPYTLGCDIDWQMIVKGVEESGTSYVEFTDMESNNDSVAGQIIVNDHTAVGQAETLSVDPTTGVSGLGDGIAGGYAYEGYTCENLLTCRPGDFPGGKIVVKVVDNNPSWPPPNGWKNRMFVKLFYQIGPRDDYAFYEDTNGDDELEFIRYYHYLQFPEPVSVVPKSPTYAADDQAGSDFVCIQYSSAHDFRSSPALWPMLNFQDRTQPAGPCAPVIGPDWGLFEKPERSGYSIFTMTQGIYQAPAYQTVAGGTSNLEGWPSAGEDVDYFWVGPLDFEMVGGGPTGGLWSQHYTETTWELDGKKILLPNHWARNSTGYTPLKMFIYIGDGSDNRKSENYMDALEAESNCPGSTFAHEIDMIDNDAPWTCLKIKNTATNEIHMYGMPAEVRTRWCNTDPFWEEADDYHRSQNPSEPNCCKIIGENEVLVEDVRYLFKPIYMDNINRVYPFDFMMLLKDTKRQLATESGGVVPASAFEIVIHDPFHPDGPDLKYTLDKVAIYVDHIFREPTPKNDPNFYWIQYTVRDSSEYVDSISGLGTQGNERTLKIFLPVVDSAQRVHTIDRGTK